MRPSVHPRAHRSRAPRALLALLASVIAWLALSLGSVARAEGDDGAAALAPRDVAVVVQPAAVQLPPLPADFERIDDGWLTLEFPASVRDRVAPLTADADAFRARLAVDLGQPVLDHVRMRIARDPEQMAALAPIGAPTFSYASGMAYPSLGVALLSLKAPRSWEATELTTLSRHELMHLALNDAIAGHTVPRWFDEGLAIHESGEQWTERLGTLWQAALAKTLLSFSDLDRGFVADSGEVNVAYAESADVVRFLMRDDDRARFGSLIQRLRSGTAFDRALGDAYDTDLRKLEYEWRSEVSHRFGVLPLLTGGGALWGLIVVLAGVAFVKRRRRAKAKLAQWAREEADMDAAAEAARERLEREKIIPVEDDDVPAHVRAEVPVVEHEGRWYILH
jgi:hypothetical protein